MTGTPTLSGVILAGGRSARMGGGRKALQPLAGKPLVRHVIERAAPQVDRLLLGVERADAAWAALGLPQVADPAPGHQGPLGGLLAALENESARAEWLLLLPCDAPFVPMDLAALLLEAAAAGRRPGAVVRLDGVLQTTFSLWHRRVVDPLREAVQGEGLGGFMTFLDRCPLAALDYPSGPPDEPPPFFNVNTPDDLARAAAWLRPDLGDRWAC